MTESEPQRLDIGDPIFAVEQNPAKIVDPKFVLSVNEDGKFVQKKKPSDKRIISNYWAKRRKRIALIGILSSFAMLSILIQETDLFNIVFGNVLEVFFYLFGLWWGLIT